MFVQEFAIDNFRSLKNVHIPRLNPITIFHGDNDVGKSNILAVLGVIFRAKEHTTEVISPDGARVEKRILGFWRGTLEDFGDNFYRDTYEPITFRVVIRFDPGELSELVRSASAISGILRKGNNPDDLAIRGKIVRTGSDTAEQELVEVRLNNKVSYEVSGEGNPVYLSSLPEHSESERYSAFEQLMTLLNDSFAVVSSRRYLTTEEDRKGEKCPLDPGYFKNWLHNLEMDRRTYTLFEEIKRLFGESPFTFGEVSFAREAKNLEIMVDRAGLRLPIGRWGTGVQQILVLLANVFYNQGKMVGIEEMEINLSERSQNNFLGTLDELIKSGKSAIRQVILSTHSYEYGRAGHVLRWFVDHDGSKTIVKPWDNVAEAELLKIRIGRLMAMYSDKDLAQIFLNAYSREELRDILRGVFSQEELREISGDNTV